LSAEAQAAIARLVLCEFETVDRREKSGVKPEQLRCCNWIRFPTSQSIATAIGEGGKKVVPRDFGAKARSQNIRPVRLIRASFVAAVCDRRLSTTPREKTSSQKEE
jgi:hypothetical protein